MEMMDPAALEMGDDVSSLGSASLMSDRRSEVAVSRGGAKARGYGQYSNRRPPIQSFENFIRERASKLTLRRSVTTCDKYPGKELREYSFIRYL
jgi:hypothetical protein